jgi:SRSO17 transposase
MIPSTAKFLTLKSTLHIHVFALRMSWSLTELIWVRHLQPNKLMKVKALNSWISDDVSFTDEPQESFKYITQGFIHQMSIRNNSKKENK